MPTLVVRTVRSNLLVMLKAERPCAFLATLVTADVGEVTVVAEPHSLVGGLPDECVSQVQLASDVQVHDGQPRVEVRPQDSRASPPCVLSFQTVGSFLATAHTMSARGSPLLRLAFGNSVASCRPVA